MQPEITVLMPNYNNAPFLREAIDSILNQTFRDFIFMIVDDGSTDNSVGIIESYTDKRIRLLRKEKNSGIVDTLNAGLQLIDTKYIMRMDSDDISLPERMESLYRHMEQHPGIGVCSSNITYFGNSGVTTGYYLDKDKIKARLIYNSGVGHPSSMFRTSILRENTILYTNDHPYMEDYDLFMRLKKYTDFANLPEVLYHYRLLEHNSTVKNKETSMARYRNIYKIILSELGIEPTEKNVELHLEFFIKPVLSFNISEYKKWAEHLLTQNKNLGVYNQEALEAVIADSWDFLFFKIVPMSLRKNMQYFLLTKKMPAAKFSYFMKFKLNKLIGRH